MMSSPWRSCCHSRVRVSPAAARTKEGAGVPPFTLQARKGLERSLMGELEGGSGCRG